MLALAVVRFLFMPVGMPPIVASTRRPSVTLLLLFIVLLISAVFLELFLNR
jgi:hypothetical protein